ncbi:hypothetical protein [Pseudomonas syringae]|uniref:hypothetical protein n=1 Tax=Pseudomonas syringae TaxID=317 RepID=UPI001F420966|nr:hypothetical protein [Pseudomonas syringae]MCF5371254.1 hypothetical protein [Pseudomonas syringae]MCF5382151.1 hypothetical protein [Pseudomonas syringae]MCF5423516.1 hypothetical protein [Pseudomonas syringae]MCF5455341.1 hypothetical protein [Pseudomonas syringae]MCF5460682.1 hypothetical protein [Pseudomonas syringae]
MKRTLHLLPLMLAILAGCNEAATTETGLKPGTAAAAKELAPEYLLKMFTVVDEPLIEGDAATVNVVIFNQNCALTMQRSKTKNSENAYGWIVNKTSCAASNLTTHGANSPIVTGEDSQVVIQTDR